MNEPAKMYAASDGIPGEEFGRLWYDDGFGNLWGAKIKAGKVFPTGELRGAIIAGPRNAVLHETLIRLAKGAITAWEKWLENAKQK